MPRPDSLIPENGNLKLGIKKWLFAFPCGFYGKLIRMQFHQACSSIEDFNPLSRSQLTSAVSVKVVCCFQSSLDGIMPGRCNRCDWDIVKGGGDLYLAAY